MADNKPFDFANTGLGKFFTTLFGQPESVTGLIKERYGDITDYNSEYYKKFSDYISKLIPQVSPDALLAPLAGSGFNYGTSQVLASKRAGNLNQKRTQAISQATEEFALGSQQQASGLLGMLLQDEQFRKQLKAQVDAQPGFFDSLLNIGGSIGGFALGNALVPGVGGLIGGGIGGGATGGLSSSSSNAGRARSGLGG